MPSIKSSKLFIKSHPTVQFDIQTFAWNKCNVENDAHTAPVKKLLSIFTLFSYKTLSLFHTSSENCKCSALLHIRKEENKSCRRRNVLWLSVHMSLKRPTPHTGREFSLLALTSWFVAPNMILCVPPIGPGTNSPMYTQCAFTVDSLPPVKRWPRGDILILD